MSASPGIPPVVAETTASLWRRVAASLRSGAGPDATPDLDARLLVGHALGLDATGLVVHAGRPVGAADVERVLALAARRAAGEPVARITGSKGFWTLDLALSPETLVPRPDTETVVTAALARVRAEGRADEALMVLDLGTGSGAILLALLAELARATGLGIDRAEGAARTARDNARRHGLDDRARFAVGNWLAAVGGRFDIVVSNPPYIPREEIAGLAVDVRAFDPDMALDGGADGLDAYRAIAACLQGVVNEGGTAFFEVGRDQAGVVRRIFEDLGWTTATHPDLAGIDRVVEVRRGKASRQKMGLEIVREPATFATPQETGGPKLRGAWTGDRGIGRWEP
jgi:release factor glutamine methyltransferase